MGSRLQFNFPEKQVPTWATNAGSTLDPDDTLSDPVPIVKENGWETNTRPPARVMNFVHKYIADWARLAMSMPLSNWQANEAAGIADIDGVVFKPSSVDGGDWTLSAGTNTYTSEFARGVSGVWTAGSGLNSSANYGAFAVSIAYTSIFGTSNGLDYSTGGAYTEVTSATIGGGFTGGVQGIDSRYPLDERTIVMDTQGVVRIAASGVNGAWTSPSVIPSLGSSAGTVGRVIHAGGNKWFAVRRGPAACFLSASNDNGDTWASGTLPAFTSSVVCAIAYDPTTARLVVCGQPTAGGDTIFYSDDDGATWTAGAGVGVDLFITTEVYSCGAEVWVGLTSARKVVLSTDNAATWHIVDMGALNLGGSSPSVTDQFLMSDGRKMLAVGLGGGNGHSLAYPDLRAY